MIPFIGNVANVAGTDFDRLITDGVAGLTESGAGQQHLIHRDIASVRVSDNERFVRFQVEQSPQHARINHSQFVRHIGLRPFRARVQGLNVTTTGTRLMIPGSMIEPQQQ